jgi:hypothetical protein
MLPGTRAEIDYFRGVALVKLNEGRWAEAVETASLAVAHARAQKDDLAALPCLFHLQSAALGMDDFVRGHEIACELEQLAVRTQNDRYLALALVAQGATRLRFGEVPEAEDLLSRGRDMLPKELGPIPEALVAGLLACAALLQGQRAGAEGLARAAMGAIRRVPWVMVELWVPLWTVCHVYCSLDDPRRFEPDIREALSMLRRMAWQFECVRPVALLMKGRWEIASGESLRAATTLRESLRAAKQHASRYCEAAAHHYLGCFALSDTGRPHVPEGAEEHLREALARFEALRARPEADESRVALALARKLAQ